MKLVILVLCVFAQMLASGVAVPVADSVAAEVENTTSSTSELFDIFGPASDGPHCTFPGSPRHGKVVQYDPGFPDNSTVEFECDDGYMLLGPMTTHCEGGVWAKGVPYCVKDVARDKPAFMLPLDLDTTEVTPARLAGLALDSNESTCAVTAATWASRMWGVALLEETTVTTLKMVFGRRLEQAELEVRVGNAHPSTQSSFNRLCWSGVKDFDAHVAIYVKCEKPAPRGRYVSIHVRGDERAPLSLCTVEVHSDTALAPEDACPHLMAQQDDLGKTVVDFFHGKCIEFHTGEQKVPLSEARNACEDRGGRLVGRGLKRHGLHFLAWRAENLFKTDAFWLDATSKQGAWAWGDGQEVDIEVVPEEDPAKQCLTASYQGAFEPVDCEREFRVVCQFEPISCGTPSLPKALKDWTLVDKLDIGQSLSEVECEDGFFSTADDALVCHRNGSLAGGLRCRSFTCGAPPLVAGATMKVLTSEAVEYSCTTGRFLKGDSEIQCDLLTLMWTNPPRCERIIDIMARKVDSVEDAVKVHFENGVKKYNSIPQSAKYGVVAALLTLTLIVLIGLVRCACLRTSGSANKTQSMSTSNTSSFIVPQLNDRNSRKTAL